MLVSSLCITTDQSLHWVPTTLMQGKITADYNFKQRWWMIVSQGIRGFLKYIYYCQNLQPKTEFTGECSKSINQMKNLQFTSNDTTE